jgi:hypothetical protein
MSLRMGYSKRNLFTTSLAFAGVLLITSLPAFSQAPAASYSQASSHFVPQVSDRVTAEVVRNRQIGNLEHNYYDSKDDIVLKIKLSNSDSSIAFNDLKGEVFIVGSSISEHDKLKLLGTEKFDCSLPARGHFEYVTQRIVTEYDKFNYGSAPDTHYHGFKYDGWVLRLHDTTGKVVLAKATTPGLLKIADKIATQSLNVEFDRK